jgi:hypothetical protein
MAAALTGRRVLKHSMADVPGLLEQNSGRNSVAAGEPLVTVRRTELTA